MEHKIENKFLKLRSDFPQLKTKINSKQIVYFDNAATSLKPKVLTDEILNFYKNQNSNIHRGISTLSNKTTYNFENSREGIKKFLGAKNDDLIFTSSATKSINLICDSLSFKKNDKILISEFEHHSNLVPFQNLKKTKKINLEFIKSKDFDFDFKSLENQIDKNTKLIPFTHISNVLGNVLNIKKAIKIIREKEKKLKTKIFILIDASQSILFENINFEKLNIDFLVFSAHKVFGEFGLGFLVLKKENLEKLNPKTFGGNMIEKVQYNNFLVSKNLNKLEAGTMPICQVITFSKIIQYILKIGKKDIKIYEKFLVLYFKKKIGEITKKDKRVIFFMSKNQSLIFSFCIEKISSYDVSKILDLNSIVVREGFLCAEPLIREKLKQNHLVRVSLNIYNTKKEIDYFFNVLENKILKKF